MQIDIEYWNNHLPELASLLLDSKIGGEIIKNEYLFSDKRKKLKYIDIPLQGISLIPFWSPQYPSLLREIPNYPVLLFACGNKSLLQKDFATIVGTRKITPYGYRVLEESLHLKKDLCLVSGLAYGVDSEVHRLCLKRNYPTIGVAAGGMEKKYYMGNHVMYKYLCKYRCVITEFPPGRKYFKGMFHMRNRILAGISKKIFVIEAGKSSGSLNTAAYGNAFGRDIFAVPNSIFSEESYGCLDLVEQGAGLVLSKSDFIDKL
jgi:DNA processing protein